MGNNTMNYSTGTQNNYLYNSQELQRELNLNTYDFGARHYDATLGRWMAIDPLAALYHDLSPYNYVENNPINLIDPDGMGPAGGDPTYGNTFNIGKGGAGTATLGTASLIGIGVSTAISIYNAIEGLGGGVQVIDKDFNQHTRQAQGNPSHVQTGGNPPGNNGVMRQDHVKNVPAKKIHVRYKSASLSLKQMMWKNSNEIDAFFKGHSDNETNGGFAESMKGGTGNPSGKAHLGPEDHIDLTNILDLLSPLSPDDFIFTSRVNYGSDIATNGPDAIKSDAMYLDTMWVWISWDKTDTITNSQAQSGKWQVKHNHSAGGHDFEVIKRKK